MARRPPSLDVPDLERELMALYAEVDEIYAGFSCPASTECCRFGVTGREPYVTSVELLVVKRAAARAGKSTSPAKRVLPMLSGRGDATSSDERPCPLLDDVGRCSIYEHRPFGCRTYYCDRATKASKVRHSTIGDFVRRLRDLGARHEAGGDEGRPLVRALGLGARKSRAG